MRRFGATVAVVGLAACGPRLGSLRDSGAEDESFAAINERIFVPSCALSVCHSGNPPPFAPMSLDPEHSWNSLVGAPSIQQPELKRVEPFSPDESYLMRKLEGKAKTRMPLGKPPLADEEVAVIRRWIERGAPND